MDVAKSLTYILMMLILQSITPLDSLGNNIDSIEEGIALLENNQFKKAIQVYSIAIDKDPEKAVGYFLRAKAYMSDRLYNLSVMDLNKAIELKPNYFDAYLIKANVNYLKGNYQKAIEDYSQAIQINPCIATPYQKISWMLSNCPDIGYRNGSKAIDFAKRAISLSPSVSSEYYNTLAAAYFESGDLEQEKKNKVIANSTFKKETYLHKYKHALKDYRQTKLINSSKYQREISFVEKNEKGAKVQDLSIQKIFTQEKIKQNKIEYPYTIQVSSYNTIDSAMKAASPLKNKNDPVFISHENDQDKGDIYYILYGYYTSFAETEKAACELNKRNFRSTRIVKRPYSIQIDLFDSYSKSKKVESVLRNKSILAYSFADCKYNCKIRLLVGAYKKKIDAKFLAKRLKEQGYSTKIVSR